MVLRHGALGRVVVLPHMRCDGHPEACEVAEWLNFLCAASVWATELRNLSTVKSRLNSDEYRLHTMTPGFSRVGCQHCSRGAMLGEQDLGAGVSLHCGRTGSVRDPVGRLDLSDDHSPNSRESGSELLLGCWFPLVTKVLHTYQFDVSCSGCSPVGITRGDLIEVY